MDTALKSLTHSVPYRVVCEQCQKILFFSGQDNPEIFKVLCDECTQLIKDNNNLAEKAMS
ncbi:hypothetical protein JCM17380_39010 [Desulfosporosinus burensis]